MYKCEWVGGNGGDGGGWEAKSRLSHPWAHIECTYIGAIFFVTMIFTIERSILLLSLKRLKPRESGELKFCG